MNYKQYFNEIDKYTDRDTLARKFGVSVATINNWALRDDLPVTAQKLIDQWIIVEKLNYELKKEKESNQKMKELFKMFTNSLDSIRGIANT